MRAVFASLLAGLGLLVIPLGAHHSFQAEFDAAKAVTLTGVVTKLEWTNPHAHFYIDVKGLDGKVANWNLELASPNVLTAAGLVARDLQSGGYGHGLLRPGQRRLERGECENSQAAGRPQNVGRIDGGRSAFQQLI